MVRPRGGSGGGAPPDAGEFSKIFKKIPEENCKKCSIFAYFAKKVQNHAVNFRALDEKHNCLGIFKNFLKILMKIQWKNGIFLYFQGEICC